MIFMVNLRRFLHNVLSNVLKPALPKERKKTTQFVLFANYSGVNSYMRLISGTNGTWRSREEMVHIISCFFSSPNLPQTSTSIIIPPGYQQGSSTGKIQPRCQQKINNKTEWIPAVIIVMCWQWFNMSDEVFFFPRRNTPTSAPLVDANKFSH